MNPGPSTLNPEDSTLKPLYQKSPEPQNPTLRRPKSQAEPQQLEHSAEGVEPPKNKAAARRLPSL